MKAKRLAAAAASVAIMASMLTALPASAYSAEKQATGTQTTIDKYLVLDKEATVPNVTSKFTIEAGEALDDPVNGIPCYAGIGTPVFVEDAAQDVSLEGTAAVVTFDAEDPTTPEKDVNTKTVAFKTTDNDSDEKFAIKTLKISFADIKFSEPGLYRYIITEETPTDGGVSIPTGSENQYTLFVTVEDNNGSLVVAQTKYILQEGTGAPALEEKPVLNDQNQDTGETVTVNTKKKTGFTNWYTTHNLMFNKLVTGNQGSRDKYFKFTAKLTNSDTDGLTMTDARNGDRFIIKGTFDLDPAVNTATNNEYKENAAGKDYSVMSQANNYDLASMTIGTETVRYVTYEQLVEGKDFYLHSGQNIEIYGIPEGLGYTVSEVKEDYTASVEIHSGDEYDANGEKSEENTKVTDEKIENNVRLTFTNTKGGTIPTGIISTIAVSAVVVLLGLAGIIGGIFLKKKKSEEE